MDAEANRYSDTPSRRGVPAGRSGLPAVKVQKFGGTTVGTVDGLRSVVAIIREAALMHRPVVVVSAVGGVTDLLEEACSRLNFEAGIVQRLVDRLWSTHHLLATGVLQGPLLHAYEGILEHRIQDVIAVLGDLQRAGTRHEALRAYLLATGERLSMPLLVLALRQEGITAVAQDATELIRTDGTYGQAQVDLEETRRLVSVWYGRLRPEVVPVITGFIGATRGGAVTTLGRSGSDYSAALLANALQASILERWTDVDGLYTDDPRTSKVAEPLPFLPFDEALTQNRAGRLGMHRRALEPLIGTGIPIHVRCVTSPETRGTLILPQDSQHPPLGLAC